MSPWSFVSPLLRAHWGWLPTLSCTCSRRGPWRIHRRGRGWAWVTRVVGQSLKVCGPELPEPSPFSLAPPCPAAPCHPVISWGGPWRRSHSAGCVGFPWVGRGQAAAVGHEFRHRAGNGPSLGPWQVTSLLEAFGTSNAAPVGQDLWMRVEVEGWGQPGFSLVSGWLRNSWGYVDRF